MVPKISTTPFSIESLTTLHGDILVIHKPAHIHSVAAKRSNLPDVPSVAEIVAASFPDQVGIGTPPEDAGLVNRLDFETSGILLAATTTPLWKMLRATYQRHGVKKEYLVLLEGVMRRDSNIEGYLYSRHPRSKKMSFARKGSSDRGQLCQALYSPLGQSNDGQFTLVRVSCTTGARHQVRALAAELGHPLCGDVLYGSVKELPALTPGSKEVLPKFFLHAAAVSLPQSMHNESITVELPSAFKEVLQSSFAPEVSNL